QPVHRDSTFGSIVRYTSSERFKERIETFDGADLVAQLRPVTFYPKEGHGDPSRQSVGFIAEEAADVDTRLTTAGPDGEPDGLDTNAMLAAVVAEVQSLRQRIASLEAAAAQAGPVAKIPGLIQNLLPQNKTQPKIVPTQWIVHTAVDAPG